MEFTGNELRASTAAATAHQKQRLATDTTRVRQLYGEIQQLTNSEVDQGRVLAVAAAAPSARDYLPYTIPELLRQIRQAGRWGDIIVGLNNGFQCDDILDYLATLPNLAVEHVYTGARADEITPSPMYADPECLDLYQMTAGQGQHRVIAVHQRQSPYAAGKIRMLGDIVWGLLLPGLTAGWRPPEYTLVLDAESLFFVNPEERSIEIELNKIKLLKRKIPADIGRLIATIVQGHNLRQPAPGIPSPAVQPVDRFSDGVNILIESLDADPDLMILGALTWFCPYTTPSKRGDLAVLLPTLTASGSGMHQIYNHTCGLIPGCGCMAGGGSLARTACLLSLLATIAATYPGTTSEDAIQTVLAEHSGFRLRLAQSVFFTNRCPEMGDQTAHDPPRQAWHQQFVRWYAGFDAVEALYGRENAGVVLGPTEDLFLDASLAVFLKHLGRTNDSLQSVSMLNGFLSCGNDYEHIRKLAAAEPDILIGPDGRPAW